MSKERGSKKRKGTLVKSFVYDRGKWVTVGVKIESPNRKFAKEFVKEHGENFSKALTNMILTWIDEGAKKPEIYR